MKKLKKLIKVTAVITTVFALSSCGKTPPEKAPEKSSEKAPEQTQAELPDLSKIEGEIVISNFNFMGQPGEESFLDTAAKMFMEKYPNTKITINNVGTPPEVKMSESEGGSFGIVKSNDAFNQEIIEYKKQVGVDLLGGGGADIYNVGTILSPVPFIEKGYLEDLNTYMNSDTTFDKNNYHANLFEAMKYKDGIYSIPTEFEFGFYSVDAEIVPENLKSEILAKQGLKYLEMLEYGIKARENSDVKSITSEPLLMCLNLYLMENLESFVDLETKKVSFNDGRLEKAIDTLKSYDEAGYLGKDINFEEMDQEKWQERMAEKYPFYTATMDDIFVEHILGSMEDIPEEEKAYIEMFSKRENAGLMFNEDGKASYTTNNSFVMNSNSKNKALSWAFIKFLLSDEIQNSLSFSGLPVQKEAIKNQISYYTSQGNIETLTEKQKEAIDNCVDDINSYVSRLDMYSFQNGNVVEIVTKAIDKFIKEDQTSKEMVDSIQSAVELYINEQ